MASVPLFAHARLLCCCLLLLCEGAACLAEGRREAELDFFLCWCRYAGGRGSLTRLKSKRPSCNLNAIIHLLCPLPTPSQACLLRRCSTESGGRVFIWPRPPGAGLGWESPLVQAPLTCSAFFFLLDIILPAEQKERREEGNFNSTPEWRVSYNQCIQGHITGCHWDSITWWRRRRRGWWVNGILTRVKGGMGVGGLELKGWL